MVRRFFGAAEGDDFGTFARRDGQPRARSDFEPRGIEQRGDIARAAFGLGITRGFAHEEGGEQSGGARHRHRGGRRHVARKRGGWGTGVSVRVDVGWLLLLKINNYTTTVNK